MTKPKKELTCRHGVKCIREACPRCDRQAKDVWWEFMGPDTSTAPGAAEALAAGLGGFTNCHCGLCGNSGVIDTRGRMRTAAGYESGVLRFCICPNGRTMKQKGWDLDKALEEAVRRGQL